MRSLTLKLTLAFLVVGLTGSIIVALLAQIQTRQEFNQYVLGVYKSEFFNELVSYYEVNNSWVGVDQAISNRHKPGSNGPDYHEPATVVDGNGIVVLGRPDLIGRKITIDRRHGVPLEVNGSVVGWMLLYSPEHNKSPEGDFLDRLNRNIVFSAAIAIMLALVIGIVLARTISHPIRDLRAATQVVAVGNLGYQVPVRTKDELGELAISFNQMSADLAESNNLRRQMTADIAHELRNPLSVILGYTEALSEGKLSISANILTVMHEEALHLQRLIEDLRILSLADAGELSLLKQNVSPLSLLERVKIAHTPHAEKRKVSLNLDVEPGLPNILVDPDRIMQVLGNLVSNALRYTPRNGQIQLSAMHGQKGIELQVVDNGAGIPAEDLPYIFERFYKADKSRHFQNGESGLGLAIAKSIVEAHNGSISAESTLGQGTKFIVRLPA